MTPWEQPSGPHRPEGLDGTRPEAGTGWHRFEVLLETPWLIQQAGPGQRALRQGFVGLCFQQVGKWPVTQRSQHRGESQGTLQGLSGLMNPDLG